MKLILLTGIILINSLTGIHANIFRNYYDQHRVTKFVKQLPSNSNNLIFIISTRNIHPQKDFKISKGVQPHYKIFLFVAAVRNDTSYIKPIEKYEQVSQYLPVDRDFLVYVDGYGKTFPLVTQRGFELSNRFGINVVIFDWPTDYLALRKTVYNASEVSVNFVKAMRQLNVLHEMYYPSSTFSVIFHSMGNRILKEVSDPYLLNKMPRTLFSNIIMNAAAVKSDHHKKWVERLDIQKRIYITMNDRDINLRGASIIRLSEQLGMGNKNKKAANACYVNFSDLATAEHNLFLGKSKLEKEHPALYTFYDLAFHGQEVKFIQDTKFHILSPSDKSFLFSVK